VQSNGSHRAVEDQEHTPDHVHRGEREVNALALCVYKLLKGGREFIAVVRRQDDDATSGVGGGAPTDHLHELLSVYPVFVGDNSATAGIAILSFARTHPTHPTHPTRTHHHMLREKELERP
jgi:hypothetical protein